MKDTLVPALIWVLSAGQYLLHHSICLRSRGISKTSTAATHTSNKQVHWQNVNNCTCCFHILQIPLPVVKKCSETTAALLIESKLAKFPQNNRISLLTYRIKIPNSQTWKIIFCAPVTTCSSGAVRWVDTCRYLGIYFVTLRLILSCAEASLTTLYWYKKIVSSATEKINK